MDKDLIERDLTIMELRQVARVKAALLSETLKQVEASRKKIVALEALREDLNRMIVHDLKNPLTGIVSAVELFLSGLLGSLSEEQKKYLGTIQLSARQLSNLISDLLDLAKFESNRLEVNKVELKAEDLQKELAWIETIAAKEEKKIGWGIEKGLIIKADEKLLMRTLENLLSNALKHSKKGGRITLNIKRAPDGILYEVIDKGEGIPAEYLDKIFEKFFKVEHQKLKTKIDTGLGLAFSKMAVEAQGGTIKVESQVGKGSRFYFHLPAA
ncbi:MAG: HAMP domain-containing sensor histidine kinase [Candidatus Margulisiibacteriota bacterium]